MDGVTVERCGLLVRMALLMKPLEVVPVSEGRGFLEKNDLFVWTTRIRGWIFPLHCKYHEMGFISGWARVQHGSIREGQVGVRSPPTGP